MSPSTTDSGPASPPVRSARELIEEARGKIIEISCEAARGRLGADKRLVLIDVREEYEYEMVRIGGSVHVARGSLEMMVEHDYPDRALPIVLYCSRGDRSALAAETLQRMGYRDVVSVAGGLHAWREKGFPVVVPSQQAGPGSGI